MATYLVYLISLVELNKVLSVLSLTLFITVMDLLLQHLRERSCGLSVRGTYMGAAIHADDLCTSAASMDCVYQQDNVIKSFSSDTCLKLNTSKCEIVRISPPTQEQSVLQVGVSHISTSEAVKCLGVWWNSSLSAKHSVTENICKARRAFLALGRLGAFQGNLNPLSSCSIFETCIIPTLLYGYETWLLDSTSLNALESFQHEIGCRILCVPKFYSRLAVHIGLHWPAVSTRILIRKLGFLSKLLSSSKDTISSRMFTSLAIEDVFETSIVQQCRMLESNLGTDILVQCLTDPENATHTVKNNRDHLLDKDYSHLLFLASHLQGSTVLVAHVASQISWRRLWDIALDRVPILFNLYSKN